VRVGIVALLHESNTFAASTTPLARFEEDLLLEGEAIRERLAGTHHEVGGFFETLADAGVEAVPVFAARAMPSGVIEADTARTLLDRLLAAVQRAGPVDGWLVAPHGAAVAEGWPDYDGHWLSELRRAVGGDVPIIGTLDLHANVSAEMVDATNALIIYRTNPHLDQRERGREAARLMIQTLRGEARPVTAAVFPLMAVNIEAQATAESPCRELIAEAEELRRVPGVLSVNLALGFPYADVAEMGASVLVTTDGDIDLARSCANRLARWWWEHRNPFAGQLVSVAEAVEQAAAQPGTVGLLDMGDNVGGGSPANSMVLIHEILRQGLGPAFVCIHAPEAVRQATQAGVGATLSLTVGEPALTAEFTVRGIFEGRFEETQARHGGQRVFNQGPTVLVERPGLTALLTTLRVAPFSLVQLTAFGIAPTSFRVLVIKGVHAPVAAYAPVCSRLIRVNTPGITSADLTTFTYQHRRRPLFPFENE
jgi:microcystin degradation protein MlrC